MIIPFESLPSEARVWVFASDQALDGTAEERLLEQTDEYLERWKAHGEPLRCARRWSDAHFLVVGVDPNTANASGCSIDGLFRTLKSLEDEIGAQLVGGGRIFYRDKHGAPQTASRKEFVELARNGVVNAETPVFDTSLTTAGELRSGFERPAGETWVGALLEKL
jgi:hypothetical protein